MIREMIKKAMLHATNTTTTITTTTTTVHHLQYWGEIWNKSKDAKDMHIVKKSNSRIDLGIKLEHSENA